MTGCTPHIWDIRIATTITHIATPITRIITTRIRISNIIHTQPVITTGTLPRTALDIIMAGINQAIIKLYYRIFD
jgi:hypothetical protein